MQLLIKQRAFTLTDNYYVYDEKGQIRYEVEADFLTLGHQIHVYDRRLGAEVGSIHQKLLTFLPEFEIVIQGRSQGTVCKEFSLFTPRYTVNYRGWTVEGDCFGWDYQILQGDRIVATISKELLNWTDTYILDFQNPADELFGLLLVIAIDAVNCSKNE